jgi:hypothetical protein
VAGDALARGTKLAQAIRDYAGDAVSPEYRLQAAALLATRTRDDKEFNAVLAKLDSDAERASFHIARAFALSDRNGVDKKWTAEQSAAFEAELSQVQAATKVGPSPETTGFVEYLLAVRQWQRFLQTTDLAQRLAALSATETHLRNALAPQEAEEALTFRLRDGRGVSRDLNLRLRLAMLAENAQALPDTAISPQRKSEMRAAVVKSALWLAANIDSFVADTPVRPSRYDAPSAKLFLEKAQKMAADAASRDKIASAIKRVPSG